LSRGRPVIASALDGIPETFSDPDHGRLVPPRDSDSLARAMIGLAEDPALARAMGERGRHWVLERYSLPQLGKRTLALYEEITRSSPASRK
jgi:glycosyltransferase involved in cell wall biosynthesis